MMILVKLSLLTWKNDHKQDVWYDPTFLNQNTQPIHRKTSGMMCHIFNCSYFWLVELQGILIFFKFYVFVTLVYRLLIRKYSTQPFLAYISVLNQHRFCPPGTFGNVCRHLWLLLLGVLLVSSRKPGMPLNILHYTGLTPPTPQQRIIWSKMSIVSTLRHPGLCKINIFA